VAEPRSPGGPRPEVTLTPVDFDPFAEPKETVGLPLTDEQAEVWSAAQMGASASCSFNQCFTVALRGELSVGALEKALHRLVERHEALRARFDPYGRGQTIVDDLRPSLPMKDLSSLPAEERAREVAGIILREGEEPFDLANGPLFRAQLLRTGVDEHRLVFTAHHIVCDGWSSGLLLRDLGALYSAERNGTSAALPAAVSYRDYLRQMVTPEEEARQRAAEDYWASRFADSVPVVELPLDRPRPTVMSYRGGQENASLPVEFQSELRKLGARHGCTMYVTLLAAFQVLVSRLAGQTDVVVGIPLAGQAQIDNGNLVGHCVHTLPLRARVDDELSFLDHMKAVRGLVLAAHENHSTTFGNLVRRLALARDQSRTPLVAIVFNVDKLGATPEFAGLGVEVAYPDKSFVNFDINLNLMETSAGLTLECSYNADLFDRTTIRRWLGHYRVLLESVVAAERRAVGELPLLTDEERRQLLVDWNATTTPLSGERQLNRIFEEQVGRTPDAIAVARGSTRLSYAELNGRANRLARYLRGRGVASETRVAVCLERSAELLVAILGVLKAGGAYVPLDPAYPPNRSQFMIQDAGARLLLTQESLRDRAEGLGVPLVSLDGEPGAFAAEEGTNLDDGAAPGNLAYVIYTSGSTGRPKGVAIEHRSAAALVRWAASVYSPRELSGVLASTSVCFDLSIFEMFVPLSQGGTVVVAENLLELPRLAGREDVTLVNTVPSVMTELLHSSSLPPSVITVNLAGEPLSTRLVDRLYEQPGLEKVYDLYGPSETTTYSTFTLRRAGEPATIGRPIANTRAYVLDRRRQPVPIGVVGELFLGGDGLARGYLDRPELTAERFVSSPFSPGERLYATGDLTRWRADGRLEYFGRADQQVKLRGFRIELGEIAACLGGHASVKDVAVVVRQDGQEERRLVAYVVSDAERTSLVDELRVRMRATLPEYMVPSAFVFLEALPLSQNGKVDKGALPAPTPATERTRARVPPDGPVQEAVAAVWKDVLGLESVDVHDNFFDLGGHSMLAARLLGRLHDTFAVDVPLRSLFQQPTVAGLADVIQALQWIDESGRATATGKREEVEI
jgi:amino acid adenylation domain-containing protein